MLKIDVLTLFPKMFEGPLTESMLRRARERKLLGIKIIDNRNFTSDKHRTADDSAYGGGGMVLKPEPIFKAVEFLKKQSCVIRRKSYVKEKKRSTLDARRPTVVLMAPDGKTFDQQAAKRLAKKKHLIFICGHYEGVDERIRKIADEEISIGDYVLTGGEIPAMAVIDAVARMVEGVVGNKEAAVRDSFYSGILDWPHYTRPGKFRNMKVPDVLLSGNHRKIEEWREKKAFERTKKRRPDLLK